jgi:hypothetical protein
LSAAPAFYGACAAPTPLHELESELIELAVATHVLDEREIAAALLAEVRRIERNAAGAAQAR